MRLLFFDNHKSLFAFKTQFLSLESDEELNIYNSLKFEIPLNKTNQRDVERLMYIGLPFGLNYQLYKAERITTEDNRISITGIDASSDDLATQSYIKDRRFVDSTIEPALDAVFQGSTWKYVNYSGNTETQTTNFYYSSRKDALKRVLDNWDVEAKFVYTIAGNHITGKTCEIHKRLGRDLNHRYVYGTSALKVNFASDITELYTALIGRGSGIEATDDQGQTTGGYTRKINFSDVVWSKSGGNPVDKPAGQEFVEIPEATAKYGWLDDSGVRQPRMGIVDFDNEKDTTKLLEETYQELLVKSKPQLSAETTVAYLGDVQLGDNIPVIRYFNDGGSIVYQARATKIHHNWLNVKASEVTVGTTPKRQADREADMQDSISGANLNADNANNQAIEAGNKADQVEKNVDQKLKDQNKKLDDALSEQERKAREYLEKKQQEIQQHLDDVTRSINDYINQNSNGPIQLIGQDGQPIKGVPVIKELRSQNGSFVLNSSGFNWGNHILGGNGQLYADGLNTKDLYSMKIHTVDIDGATITSGTIDGNIYIRSTGSNIAVMSGDHGFSYGRCAMGSDSIQIGGFYMNATTLYNLKLLLEKNGMVFN